MTGLYNNSISFTQNIPEESSLCLEINQDLP